MSDTDNLAAQVLPEINAFQQSQRTLLIASTNADHQPNASYAPFAMANDGFYILVSDIAKHGQNLKQQQTLSVMMIEDEDKARSIYARMRLTYEVDVVLIERDNPDFIVGTDALIDRFGAIAKNLRDLSDFNLYHLHPKQGRFVKGFGKAFEITGTALTNIHWLQGNGEGKGHGERLPAPK